jgi:hypothetical protein
VLCNMKKIGSYGSTLENRNGHRGSPSGLWYLQTTLSQHHKRELRSHIAPDLRQINVYENDLSNADVGFTTHDINRASHL